MPPHPRALGPEGFDDARGCEDRSEGKVAARDPLRAHEDVGFHAEPRGGEPVAAAAESRDDLVGHEQDVGVTADLANRLEVAVGRWVHAPRADHRLAEERRHPVLPDVFDRGPQRVRIVPGDLDDVFDQRAVPGRVRGDSCERCPRRMHPVVGLLSPDQDRAIGFTDELPVVAGHLGRRVDRVGAAAREEDLGIGDRGETRDSIGELEGHRDHDVAEVGVRRQLRHLGRRRLADLPPAPTDVAVPEGCGRIEVALPLDVPDVAAFATVEDELASRHDGGHVGERMPERLGHGGDATSSDAGRGDP